MVVLLQDLGLILICFWDTSAQLFMLMKKYTKQKLEGMGFPLLESMGTDLVYEPYF